MKRPLDILILSDGRPGHFNLSEGVAAAIEKQTPATTRKIDVRRGSWPGHVLAAMTRTKLPAKQMLQVVYGIREANLPASDVVISAGAETLAASIWLARARSVPNIFYGSIRLFDPYDFDLILTSYARNATRPRHAMALKPSRMDPDTLRRPRPLSAPDLTIGLLIGGNTTGITYTPQDWHQLINAVQQTLDQTSWTWRIANSRRTPPHATQNIAELSRSAPERVNFLDVTTAGAGTLDRLIEASDALICTADSSSMISECVWSKRPTISAEPANCLFSLDEKTYRDWLTGQKACANLAINHLSTHAIRQAFQSIEPLTHNPQSSLGTLIGTHIPPLLNSRKTQTPR